MTDAALREMLDYCNMATPAPWQTRFIHRLFRAARDGEPVIVMGRGRETDWDDADFISHARTDLPAVVKGLLEARELLRERGPYCYDPVTMSWKCWWCDSSEKQPHEHTCRYDAFLSAFEG